MSVIEASPVTAPVRSQLGRVFASKTVNVCLAIVIGFALIAVLSPFCVGDYTTINTSQRLLIARLLKMVNSPSPRW